MIRVGRAKYNRFGKISYPSYEDFEAFPVMMGGHSEYWPVSPYYLKDEEDRIMENVWQFSKIYEAVPNITVPYSRWDKKTIWAHPAETHVDHRGRVLPAYWAWREKGMQNEYAVRYPVGRNNSHKCLYAIPDSDHTKKLDYLESRLEIYIPTYCELAKKEGDIFPMLKEKLENGHNILLIEPDGPHQELMPSYVKDYSHSEDFIENDTVLINDESLTTLVFDTRVPFGHGYCLAMALMDTDESLLEFWKENFFV